jgi:glutathione S-transferase
MKFYNAWYCPFAQRAWMALVYKDIDFDYIEVDPYDFTDSWLEISRGFALVPVVIQSSDAGEDITIVESIRILEYLEDYYPEKAALFADNANARSQQKYWMDHIGNKITPCFYRYLKREGSEQAQQNSLDELLEGLSVLVQAMDSEGPYFSGDRLDVVDIALMPFSLRIDLLLGRYRNFELPRCGDGWQRYHHWYEAMLAQPAFRSTALDLGNYESRLLEHYLPYNEGAGQSDLTRV